MQISKGNCDLVLIHDAARPNINSKLIDEVLGFASKSGNSVIGTKITDTIKLEKKGMVLKTVDREFLWTVQTPQVFKYKDLSAAYQKNRSNAHTDESSLVESCGFKVKIFEGPKENIKLTGTDDLTVLKKLMS
jgi:2-C-methyl-D-erythritol 4-phosphate cytidylyltransferase